MFKHPQFWLGLSAFAIGLVLAATSCGISFEGASLWTGLVIAGFLGAAMSPAQVIVSSALSFASRPERIGLVGLLVLLIAGDFATTYAGFDARAKVIEQDAADRNQKFAAASEAMPAVRDDLARWQRRFDAMEAARSANADYEAIYTAQGYLSTCAPTIYAEEPDGRLGPNTRAGISACAAKAEQMLPELRAEQRRLQTIVEAGADTVANGTSMLSRVLLSVALIFFSNVLAFLGGHWMCAAKEEADDANRAIEIDDATRNIEDMSDWLDQMIGNLARA